MTFAKAVPVIMVEIACLKAIMLLYAYVAPVFLAVDVKQYVIKKIIF